MPTSSWWIRIQVIFHIYSKGLSKLGFPPSATKCFSLQLKQSNCSSCWSRLGTVSNSSSRFLGDAGVVLAQTPLQDRPYNTYTHTVNSRLWTLQRTTVVQFSLASSCCSFHLDCYHLTAPTFCLCLLRPHHLYWFKRAFLKQFLKTILIQALKYAVFNFFLQVHAPSR